MADELTEPQHRAVENLIRSGKILDAIKLYRSYTDCSLLDAKVYIESRMKGYDLDPSQLQTGAISHTQDEPKLDHPDDVWKLIEANLYNGRKIEAIRLAREAFGGGLKDAKEMVDAHETLLRETHPERFQQSVGGCAFSGCTVRMSAFLLGAGALGWLIFG